MSKKLWRWLFGSAPSLVDQDRQSRATVPLIRQSVRDEEHAAMLALWPLPRVIPGPYYITQREIDSANERVRELRVWVDSAPELTPSQRKAYRGWLDFCANDNQRAQVSLDTNERARFQEKWDADRRREAENARRVNIPKPPSAKDRQ